MKVNYKFMIVMAFVLLAGTVLTLSSCGGDNENSTTPYLYSSPQKLLFNYKGEAVYQDIFHIVSNEKWTIDSHDKWISIDKTFGVGNAEIAVKVLEYNEKNERNGIISVTSESGINSIVSVEQEAYTHSSQPDIVLEEDKLLGSWDMFFIDDGWDKPYKIYLDITFESKESKYGTIYSYLAKVYYDVDEDGKYTDYKGDIEGMYSVNSYTNKFEFVTQYSTLASGYSMILKGVYNIIELENESFIFRNLNVSLVGNKR